MGQRTDISGLDHAHVVPTVTDTAHALLSIAPDEPGDICLLCWGTSTRDNGGEFGGDLNELILKQGKAELQKHELIRSAITTVRTWFR